VHGLIYSEVPFAITVVEVYKNIILRLAGKAHSSLAHIPPLKAGI
jgi:hypothetical protein